MLVAGFGVLTDGRPLRMLDFKESRCSNASNAVGSACPSGCMARPINQPSERSLPTECHSRLWLATCGKECEPASGLARLEDGRLVDGRRMLLVLENQMSVEQERAIADLGAVTEQRFDGMYRYDLVFNKDFDESGLAKTKKRLEALSGTLSVDYVLR